MSKSYAQKLKDPRWQQKRLDILSRDGWHCTLCFDPRTTLHVHHKTYHGEPWETPDEELVTLCEHCHLLVEDVKKAGWMPIRVSKNVTETDSDTMILAMLVSHPGFGNGVCLYSLALSTMKLTCVINLGAQLFWTLSRVIEPMQQGRWVPFEKEQENRNEMTTAR